MAVYHEDIATIELESGKIHRSFAMRSIGSGDSAANRFGIRVLRNGEEVDLSGCSCYGYFRDPQGNNIALTANGTVDGSLAYVTLPQACYNYEGQFCLAIKLIGGGVTGTMRIVDGMVDNTHTGGAVAPTGAVPSYSEILSQYDAMVAATAAANGCIAETFDAEKAYSAGKYVINEGTLYRLTADHAANTTWANTSKTAVKFGDELYGANKAIGHNDDCDVRGLVPYAKPCTPYTPSNITIMQNGNLLIINGVSSATVSQATTKIVISGMVRGWNATSDPDDAKVYPLELQKGHKYRLSASVKSGTRDAGEGNGNLTFTLMSSSETKASFAIGTSANSGSADWVCDGSAVQIRMKWSRLLTLTNIVLEVTLRDLTPDESAEDVKKLISAVGENKRNILEGFEKNYYWNIETTTAVKTEYSSYYAFVPIPVSEGDRIKAKVWQATSSKQKPVVIVDEDYTVLKMYSGTSSAENTFDFICPENSAYLLITTQSVEKANAVECERITMNSFEDFAMLAKGVFDFAGKNVAIIGDSISTNGNYSEDNPFGNVPEIVIGEDDINVELSAYATYYDIGTTVGGHEIVAADVGTEITFTPQSGDEGKIVGKPYNRNASSVKTWWEVASEALGFNPIPVAWSGSSITSHEGDENAYKTSYAWHPAQIRKCGIRESGSMTRKSPDMVIIYRGTNDMTHSPYARLTDYLEHYPVNIPATDAFDDSGTTRYDYIRGLLLTIAKVHEAYPAARVVLCTFNYFHRLSSSYSGYPSRNGINTIYEFNNAIREVANYTGCDVIEFDKDGLTYANASSTYYQDSSPDFVHPTTAGHAIMGNRAICDLTKVNKH